MSARRPGRRAGHECLTPTRAAGPGRPGFVLLAVLWTIVGATTLALAMALVAREALAAARNRAALTRAAWLAEGCAEAARAAVGDVLAAGEPAAGDPWATLDRAAVRSPNWAQATACDVTLVPAGAKVDLNAADREQLAALFVVAGNHVERADSLADALLDWCDPDDRPRPRGAEREWYVAAGRRLPRGVPLGAAAELALVRGFDSATVARVAQLAWVEPGRLALRYAPRGALATLPGFGAEVTAAFDAVRATGTLPDVPWLASQVSPEAAAVLGARYPEFVRLATATPDAWLLTSRASAGTPAVWATFEVRLTRVGARAAVARQRPLP